MVYDKCRFDEAMENTIKVKKVEIPDYIAQWIDYCKFTNVDFVRSFLVDKYCLYNYAMQSDSPKIKEWLKSSRNIITFIDAWDNGYTVKETYYYVAIPCGNNSYRHVFVNDCNNLVVSNYLFKSEEEIKKLAMAYRVSLTEDIIKKSPISWTWQFAKELED